MTIKEIEDKLFSYFLYMPTLPVKTVLDFNVLHDYGDNDVANITDCYIADYVESECRDYGIVMDSNVSVQARNGEGFTVDDLEYLEQIYPTMAIEDMTSTEILQKFKQLKWQTAIFLVIGGLKNGHNYN